MHQKVEGHTLVIRNMDIPEQVNTDPFKLEKNYMVDVEDHTMKIRTANSPKTDFIKKGKGYYTAKEIIEIFDEEYRNQIPHKTKMRWLEEIERLIQNETIETHVTPAGYDPRSHFVDFGPQTVMYAYAPYHIVYSYYLRMRAAQVQNDTKILNTVTTLYNNAILTFQQEYNRNNPRKPVRTPYYNHARGGY